MSDKTKKELVDWGKSILSAVILTILFLKFIAFFAVVPTGSMIPTINEGDRIFVVRFFKYFDSETKGLKYGDKVVFTFDDNGKSEEKLLVKRVIGMPGDTISIDNGYVYRNGEKIEEDYVKNKDSFFMKEIKVPDGEIFVLGDNRPNSYDARYWDKQTVPLSDVVGEMLFGIPSLF